MAGGTESATIGAGIAGTVVGATIGIIVLASNPVGWVAGGIIAISSGIGLGLVSAGTVLFAGEPPEWAAVTVFVPYNEYELKSLGCQRLEVKQK